MASFWDARARENALYFVDNTLDYGHPDTERFWRDGEIALGRLLGALGVDLTGREDVVEIGCGVGRITRALATQARSVAALDISAEMLARARALCAEQTNVRWIRGDGVSLAELAPGSADACVSHVTFQHAPEAGVTLGYVREMGRVLRPGGWSAFQFSNDPSVHRPRGLIRRLATRLRGFARATPRGQDHPAWRGSAVRLEDLRATCAQAGLAVETVVGAGTQFCAVLLRRTA
jgi:SAM-dependent methyltransferase